MTRKDRTRLILSLVILWHLFIVFIAPNNSLEPRRSPTSFVSRYIQILGLGPYWSFFAPEPGPPPLFVEYEITGDRDQTLERSSWPLENDPFFFRDRQNRRISLASFMVVSPSRVDRVMTNYLCRKHPEAVSIRLWRSRDEIPSMEQVSSGQRKLKDPSNRVRDWVSKSYCPFNPKNEPTSGGKST